MDVRYGLRHQVWPYVGSTYAVVFNIIVYPPIYEIQFIWYMYLHVVGLFLVNVGKYTVPFLRLNLQRVLLAFPPAKFYKFLMGVAIAIYLTAVLIT